MSMIIAFEDFLGLLASDDQIAEHMRGLFKAFLEGHLNAPGSFLHSLETLKTRMMFHSLQDARWLDKDLWTEKKT